MAKVSCIVPIYNVEAYLDRCLSSLKHQTFTDFEVLCVNDGSTDGSQAVIDRFVQSDPRFFSYTKTNGGLSDARNFGLARVTSEYVMFPDSDDFVQPEMIEKALRKIEKEDLDCVVFDYYQYFDETGHKEVISLPFREDIVYSFDTHPELVAYVNNAAWNKLYKTSIFKTHGLEYPFGYRHQDLGTTFRYLSYCQRIGFIQEPLYDYLADRPNNLTQMFDHKIDHILAMIDINVRFFKETGKFEAYREQLCYLSGINLFTSFRKLRNFRDAKFVLNFIDRSFDYMEEVFPAFPKCDYPLMAEANAFIYGHRNILKLYYLVTLIRRKI